jgi:hypothetical protein
MPGSITVSPTAEFFMLDDVMVRAWEGFAADGTKVVALISAIRSEGPLALEGLTSIPGPPDDHSLEMRDALGRLWGIVHKLLPIEIEAMAALVENTAARGDDPLRADEARAFITEMDRRKAAAAAEDNPS